MHKSVDIVLLPPRPVMERAVAFNKTLGPKGGILLDQETCLPHISLAMACIRAEDVHVLSKRLDSICLVFHAISLTIPAISARPDGSGQYTYSYEISPNSELQALHEAVLDILMQLHIPGSALPQTLCTPEWSQSSLDWIENYAHLQSAAHFWPHITLGIGHTETLPLLLPPPFCADRLALCHLGNHCTCRKLLWEGYFLPI